MLRNEFIIEYENIYPILFYNNNFELSSGDPLLTALCHVSIKLKSDDSIILVWTGQ